MQYLEKQKSSKSAFPKCFSEPAREYKTPAVFSLKLFSWGKNNINNNSKKTNPETHTLTPRRQVLYH
jgi:hypothetical protein